VPPYNYILGQLAAWFQGTRKGDPLGMMGAMTERLSVAAAKSVAAFYASLPAVEAFDMAAQIENGTLVPDAVEMAPPPEDTGTADGLIHSGPLAHHGAVPTGRDSAPADRFDPPARNARPDGELGEMIALGESIFSHTYSHEVSGKYVGNHQVCEGCHLDAGRLADSAPLWASWVAYPAYRKKNKKINTMIERVQGCFNLEGAVGRSSGCVPRGAEQGTTRRNSDSLVPKLCLTAVDLRL
jgi:thiosulfate dehydrogenase